MDLAQWVADGRWEALLELIDQLPSACRLNEAIAQDEEAAEFMLKAGDPTGTWSPRVAEFDLTNSLLVSLINEVKMLRQSGIAVAGGKPKKETPFPSPRTAVDKVRERLAQDEAKHIAYGFGFGPEDFN